MRDIIKKWQLNESLHYLVYDDVCALCNAWVRFVIRRDHADVFRFIALQSELGQQLADHVDVKEGIETVILLSSNKLYTQSDVSFKCLRTIGSGWLFFMVFLLVPSFIRNSIYRLIAKNRYRWFGKYDQCPIIPDNWKYKFIH